MNLFRKPSIDGIHLDLAGWTPHKSQPHLWNSSGPDMLRLLYFAVPTQLPCFLDEPDCWPPYFANMIAKDNGAVVSVDVLPIQGLRAVRTIFKYHQPAMNGLSDLGVTYLGTWMVPFADFSFNIQVQSFETGTTGTREAAVFLMMHTADQLKAEKKTEPPRVVTSMDALFNGIRTRRMERIRADDEEFDQQFPDHPLSRLRTHLQHIAETLKVDIVIKKARPYEKR